VGDILCLSGATLYAISNVGQEGCVKQFDGVEFLAMLGMFGSGLNIVQSYVTPRVFYLESDILYNI
jgi:solute carrier family 35 protein F1/2